MPRAAKAGRGILAGCCVLESEASQPGKAEGSVSVPDFVTKPGTLLVWAGHCCHTAVGRRGAEGLINGPFYTPPAAAVLRTQQVRDSYTWRGHINTDLTRQQPSLKAPNVLLASSPYLTTTSQQMIGTATEKFSLFSSLPCSGSPCIPQLAGVLKGLQAAAAPACPSCPSWEGQCNHLH